MMMNEQLNFFPSFSLSLSPPTPAFSLSLSLLPSTKSPSVACATTASYDRRAPRISRDSVEYNPPSLSRARRSGEASVPGAGEGEEPPDHSRDSGREEVAAARRDDA